MIDLRRAWGAMCSVIDPVQDLEIMSADIGPVPDGLDRTPPGHYPLGTLRITASLLAGVGLVGASALAGNDLAATQTSEHATSSVFKSATKPTDFSGGVAGAVECIYDNYNPLDDFYGPASQKEPVYPFYAEAADDFTLLGGRGNVCILDEVIFAVAWFGVPGAVTPSPDLCWAGVNITIYEDAEAFCGAGFLKGPAGEPLDPLPQGHIEYCPGAVKCEIKTDLSHVSGRSLTIVCLDIEAVWEILITNLAEEQCLLEKNHKYWIAIAPEQQFAICGQTGIVLSANEPQGHPAQQIFLILGFPWIVIEGNLDACPPDTPPAGSHRDLSIGIAAIKEGAGCKWDLANDDGIVDARDLAVLLGAWGNPYSPVELANLLGAWGPC